MGTKRRQLASQREVALVDLVDRALNAGVVISGDITISLADIDLVYLDLRLLLGSVPTLRRDLTDALDEGQSVLLEESSESGR
jgi:gas vesicle structural protein